MPIPVGIDSHKKTPTNKITLAILFLGFLGCEIGGFSFTRLLHSELLN
jgi:hypothetical protein